MELIGIAILSLAITLLLISVFSLLIYKYYKVKLKNIENNINYI